MKLAERYGPWAVLTGASEYVTASIDLAAREEVAQVVSNDCRTARPTTGDNRMTCGVIRLTQQRNDAHGYWQSKPQRSNSSATSSRRLVDATKIEDAQ